MKNQYTPETRKGVLDAFEKRYGSIPTSTIIEREGGITLFKSLTGASLTSSGIYQFLKKAKDPEGYATYTKSLPSYNKRHPNKPKSSIELGSGNPLFKLSGDTQFILVPSHGDIHCFDTAEQVKEAIEKFQSANVNLIKFKLLKSIPIKVQATVTCHIG